MLWSQITRSIFFAWNSDSRKWSAKAWTGKKIEFKSISINWIHVLLKKVYKKLQNQYFQQWLRSNKSDQSRVFFFFCQASRMESMQLFLHISSFVIEKMRKLIYNIWSKASTRNLRPWNECAPHHGGLNVRYEAVVFFFSPGPFVGMSLSSFSQEGDLPIFVVEENSGITPAGRSTQKRIVGL